MLNIFICKTNLQHSCLNREEWIVSNDISGKGSIAKVAHVQDPDGTDIALVQWNDDFEETNDRIMISVRAGSGLKSEPALLL